MNEKLTQEQLAELIRAGYKKHNLSETNETYYSEFYQAACPIFAAIVRRKLTQV